MTAAAFKDGLDRIHQSLGAPAINNDTVCTLLLRLDCETGLNWAKAHHLPLGHDAYYAWLNRSISKLDSIEIEHHTDWIVHPNKSDAYKGALIALAVLGGRSMDVIEYIDGELGRVEGRNVAHGICSVMYKHLGNDAKSIMKPSYEAMAWVSKRCPTRMFKEGADAIMMDEECYAALIKPFIQQVKGAQSNVDALLLEGATKPASKKNATPRL